jgi:heat shock protein HtpX
MAVTMGLLVLVYLGFMAAMFAAGVDSFLLFIMAAGMLGVQYFFSDKLVLASAGAKVVEANQAPDLHAMIDRLVQAADLPKPKVAIINSPVPNAFATGRSPKASAVAVSTGLLETLEPPELEAVIAHELTHIKNRDVAVITLASFFSTVAQFVMRSSLSGGGGRRRDKNGSVIIFFAASILTWIISFFLIRALSRYREFAADRGAALLTGSPAALQSALIKISGTMQRVPQQDLREVQGMNAFFIVPVHVKQSVLELFSTHPSIEKRIAYLDELAREMERYR